MKKQYTKEYAYDRNIKITFYENGVKTYFTIMSEWEVDGYLAAKHEDGWVEAYSQEQYDENEKAIQELLDDLEWRQKWREERKGNLIKEDN